MGRVLVDEHLAETVDTAQRRAQIVCHGVTERFELAIRLLKRGRSLHHSLFELCVQLLDLLELLPTLGDIAQHQHATEQIAVRIDDRCGGFLDRDLATVA